MRPCANARDARLLGVDDFEAGRGLQLDIPAPLQADYEEAYREVAAGTYRREDRAWASALARRLSTTQHSQAAPNAGQTAEVSGEELEPLCDGSGCHRVSTDAPGGNASQSPPGLFPGDGA